jgi:hypothetical protein
MLTKQGMFRKPALLTLTVARDQFDTPEQAFGTITDTKRGLLRRLMRSLDVRLWVWVLEFQQMTCTGWPHWHFLIDLDDLPNRRLDLGKAWHLWRDKWALGGIDLQARPNGFKNAAHAINYITKYLIKQPKMGYPLWVLEWEAPIRFFQASGMVGGVLAAAKAKPKPLASDEEDPKPRQRGNRRTFVDRMSACKQYGVAFYEEINPDTGESLRRYLGPLSIRPDRLAYLATLGKLNTSVETETVINEYDDEADEQLCAYINAPTKAEAADLLEKLNDELSRKGESRRAVNKTTERYRRIREENEFAKREQVERPDDEIPF